MTFASLHERLFYESLRIRRAEERVIEIYPSDRIQSPVHLSIGQEAIAVGVCEPLSTDDPLFGSYRSHAFFLAKGGSMRDMFAELYGKATGGCGGKAGSMHLTAPEVGFMGSSAVVASTIPNAVGAALAARRRGTTQVIVTVFGDGATEEGVYHESLNFAALHQLPVLFVCENNGLAVHSKLGDRQAYDICSHASTYGITTEQCAEGWDFVRVSDVAGRAVDEIRSGGGPRFIEYQTYRYQEHVGIGCDHDVGYRERASLEAWQAHDPLRNEPELVEAFEAAIREEIDDAVQFAEESPWPGPEHLLADVA